MPESRAHALIAQALGRIPQGLYILTARHEDRRGGLLVSSVQLSSVHPPMVLVAVPRGRPILPLISDSLRFGLCQLPREDHGLLRRFTASPIPDDPFLGLDLLAPHLLGLPLLAGSLSCLECEVASHVDVEGDHDLFVGRVCHVALFPGEPAVHFRSDGARH